MPKLPHLPLFVNDLNADTSHLTHEEFGIYIRLLCLMWNGPDCRIPDDDEWLSKRLHSPIEDVAEKVRPIIDEFCEIRSGRISQKRLEREYNFVSKKSENRSRAAKSRWDNDKKSKTASASHVRRIENASASDKRRIENADALTPTPIEDKKTTTTETLTPRDAPDEKPLGGGVDVGVEIIAIFDRVRGEVFGENQRRPYPAGNDLSEARKMLSAGATPDVCEFVFRSNFQRQLANGDQPAGSLKYLTGAIERAMAGQDPALDVTTPSGAPKTRRDFEREPGDWSPDERREIYYLTHEKGVAERDLEWNDAWGERPPIPRPTTGPHAKR